MESLPYTGKRRGATLLGLGADCDEIAKMNFAHVILQGFGALTTHINAYLIHYFPG